jgi:hypothetical protein
MKKIMGGLLIVLGLVIAIVPVFTDCLSQGKQLTTAAGALVPMKCHWTAMASIGVGLIMGLAGIFSLFSKRNETTRTLSGIGGASGALAIAFPTVLIGVCANPMMYCNMVEKPTLILSGIVAIAASAVIFGVSRKNVEAVG